MNNDIISFYITFGNETKQVHTYTNAYRNLMHLLEDQFIVQDFGECMGMGKCGTCMIEVIAAPNLLEDLQRNEMTTLKKAAMLKKNIRLSCQIFINDSLQDAVLKIYEWQ